MRACIHRGVAGGSPGDREWWVVGVQPDSGASDGAASPMAPGVGEAGRSIRMQDPQPLSPEDRAAFLREWGFDDGALTDSQIQEAIAAGLF